MAVDEKILDLRQRTEAISLGGGQKAIEKQKAIGKMTARERIAALLDEGSFRNTIPLYNTPARTSACRARSCRETAW